MRLVLLVSDEVGNFAFLRRVKGRVMGFQEVESYSASQSRNSQFYHV